MLTLADKGRWVGGWEGEKEKGRGISVKGKRKCWARENLNAPHLFLTTLYFSDSLYAFFVNQNS